MARRSVFCLGVPADPRRVESSVAARPRPYGTRSGAATNVPCCGRRCGLHVVLPESTLMVVQLFVKVFDGHVLFGEHHVLARQPACSSRTEPLIQVISAWPSSWSSDPVNCRDRGQTSTWHEPRLRHRRAGEWRREPCLAFVAETRRQRARREA